MSNEEWYIKHILKVMMEFHVNYSKEKNND